MSNRRIELILPAAESLLPGDFVVHRALPRRELRRVGGFVFLDHFDQPDITPELFDVPPHPHIGLQTVTYLFEGEILHTDSLDYQQPIVPGDVNWMTAGRGITHSEQVTRRLPRIHGIQSWVGLPHKDRKTAPDFRNFSGSELPVITGEGFTAKIIAGHCGNMVSPIPTFQQLTYFDVKIEGGATASLPVDRDHELAVYVCQGEVEIGDTAIKRFDLAKLSPGGEVAISAKENASVILLGGEPLPEPTVIYWNFITDTVGEAKQAMLDWEAGKFPPVKKYVKISHDGDEQLEEKMKLL
jgi:quercetin 2,3-dioxygenase